MGNKELNVEKKQNKGENIYDSMRETFKNEIDVYLYYFIKKRKYTLFHA